MKGSKLAEQYYVCDILEHLQQQLQGGRGLSPMWSNGSGPKGISEPVGFLDWKENEVSTLAQPHAELSMRSVI